MPTENNMEFNKAVGLRIKEARTNKHLSLKELGMKVGLSEGTMQRYETGQIKGVDINLLKKIADVLECTPAYLIGVDNFFMPPLENYTDKEKDLIEKYREADDEIKFVISKILNLACNRATAD